MKHKIVFFLHYYGRLFSDHPKREINRLTADQRRWNLIAQCLRRPHLESVAIINMDAREPQVNNLLYF